MALCQKSIITKEENLKKYFEYVVCNLCGSNVYKILFTSTISEDDLKHSYAQYSISQKSPGYGQIVQCKRCGLVYVNPREKYRDIIRNYSMVQDEKYLTEESARSATFRRELDLIEKFCPHKGSLLDVGCFTGLFLELARRRGWSVSGIEPSHWAVAYAREKLNLNLMQGVFEDFKFDDRSFDAITLWDVIEHITDPKSTLLALHKKLKDQGILLLNTFNYDSIFRRIFGKKYWFIERMHIYYFNPGTIKKMLEACNYKVLKVIPHFKTLSLGYYITRLRDVNRPLAAIIEPVSSLFALGKRNITMHVGQMTIIASKR